MPVSNPGTAASKDLLSAKQSVTTTLTVNTEEFDNYQLGSAEALITVSLKEIKALTEFALGMGDVLSWYFSNGGE